MNIITISNGEENEETKTSIHRIAFRKISLGDYQGFGHQRGINNLVGHEN